MFAQARWIGRRRMRLGVIGQINSGKDDFYQVINTVAQAHEKYAVRCAFGDAGKQELYLGGIDTRHMEEFFTENIRGSRYDRNTDFARVVPNRFQA